MTMAAPTTASLSIGDTVPIGTTLVNMILMAVQTDINNPNLFAATIQGFQSKVVMTVPALQGIPGPPGQPEFALKFQASPLASPDDLPSDLGNTNADLGKYWVFNVLDDNGNAIATTMYVWYGTDDGWQEFPVGAPGPVGAYPLITPQIVMVEPGNGGGPNGADSWVHVSGTLSNPTFTFYIAAPQGVAGPTATLESCPDVDVSSSTAGQALTCSNRVTPGAPVGLTLSPSSSGGAFAAGTYFWSVTSILANGAETLTTNEVTAQLVGSTSSCELQWTAPSGGGAVGYRVYRGTSATNLNVLVATINDASVTSYTDTGAAGTPSSPPHTGVVAGRKIWVPKTLTPVVPLLFTVPVSAFTSVSGVGSSQQPVCTFSVPPQPWAWKPFVFAQMQVFGINISFSPLLVGAQVLLGDPSSGQVVASGTGNNLGAVNLIPNAASTNKPSTAMTPTNSVGLVPANHTGNQGTLYVNLVSEGMAGTYDFNSDGASMVVLVIPMPGSTS